MTTPVSTPIAANTPVTLSGGHAKTPERLQDVAREFEALFIHQVLQQMRNSSRLLGNDDGELFGARLVETIDVELARQLAMGGGLGLADMLASKLLGGHGVSGGQSFAVSPSVSHRPEPRATEAVAAHVTSGFGLRNDPIAAGQRFHAGVDLRAAYGREIGAAEAGRVVSAGEQGGYGLTVVIEHASGVQTRYAHLSSLAVAEGDSVDARDLIGRAGQTGRATGSHLHFELIRDGVRVDPATITGGLEGLLGKLRLAADISDSQANTGASAGAEDDEG